MCDYSQNVRPLGLASWESMSVQKIILLIVLVCSSLFGQTVHAQCVVYDGQGTATATPTWVSCSGGAYTLYIQSPNNFGYLIIDWGDGSANTTVASLISPAFLSHTYVAAIDNYTVTITDTTNNCTITGLVVMEEPVNASIQIPIGGVTQICAPDDMVFTNSSTDVSQNTVFTWDFGDGSAIVTYGDTNAGQTISHTYESGTVDCVTEVTLTAENYCSFGNPTEATFNPIQVFDVDEAEITADNILLCYPDTVVHYDNTTDKNCVPQGNVAQRFEYWNFGNYWGTGSDSIIDWTPFDPPAKPGYDIAYPGLGTYTTMMIDSNMCGRDTAYITIDIVAPPTAGVSADLDSACTGTPVTFTNLSTGGTVSFINYGEGGGYVAMGASSSHAYGSAGTYQVALVTTTTGGTGACTDTAFVTVEILPSPTALTSISPAGGCDTVLASFINSSSGGVSYFWTFGNGDTSSLQNPPPILYTSSGNWQVTLLVTGSNGCDNSDTAYVSVYDSPTAHFGFANVCEDELASFIDSSTAGFGGPVSSWLWSFGDSLGSTDTVQNPFFTFTDSGTYVVTLVASTPYCTDSIAQSILVEPRPTASFTMSDTVGCSPLTVNFSNLSVGGTNYYWQYSDGNTSTAVSPIHTFTYNGLTDTTFYIQLVVESAFGCLDSITDSVVVMGNPIASFGSDAILDCAPLVVAFSDSSVNAVSWNWNFGDSTGSVGQNPTHTFENQTQFITNYTVQLIVTGANGCTDTTDQVLTVYPEPLYNFTISPDSGCSPLTVQFPVAVGAVLYSWAFGDGDSAVGPTPTHTYINNTTNNAVFTATLIATSPFGCIDTATGDVNVFPLPSSSFTPPISEGCGPLNVTFTNTSTGGSVYEWVFGTGDTLVSSNITVSDTFTNSSNDTLTYNPMLIATTNDGCSDTAFAQVDVFRFVHASFTAPSSACHPLSASFVDGSTNAVSWDWDFDNGFTSVNQHPQQTFTNTGNNPLDFDVNLEVTSVEGCTDDTTITVEVRPKPQANYTITSSPACHNESVTFDNLSNQNTFNYWQYGSGNASVLNNSNSYDTSFSNFGQTPAQFSIRLIVENAFQCFDTLSKNMEVYPIVEAQFVGEEEGCSPLEIEFDNVSTGGSLFEWDFGDGNISFLDEPTHTFVNNTAGDITFQVTLEVTSPYGCTNMDSGDVLVHPTPIPLFTATPMVQKFPSDTVTFDNLTSNGNWQYDWDFGDGETSAMEEPGEHDYATWGEYRVLLTASSEFCQDTVSRPIIIEPPVPLVNLDTFIEACAPLTAFFEPYTIYGTSYLWEFGDGGASSSENPQHTYQFPGSYDLKLTVEGPGGDVVTKTLPQAVVIHEQPIANFVYTPDQVNVPLQSVSFINYSQFADYYLWNFGDTNSSSEENPVHRYQQAGEFFPQLIASTDHCSDTMISLLPVTGIVQGDLEIPNAFTPNPNGSPGSVYDPAAFNNQVFFPVLSGVAAEGYTLSIFNRWGELIFETQNIDEGWDGYYRGKLCQQDAYVWKITGNYVTGENFAKVGDVTLIR